MESRQTPTGGAGKGITFPSQALLKGGGGWGGRNDKIYGTYDDNHPHHVHRRSSAHDGTGTPVSGPTRPARAQEENRTNCLEIDGRARQGLHGPGSHFLTAANGARGPPGPHAHGGGGEHVRAPTVTGKRPPPRCGLRMVERGSEISTPCGKPAPPGSHQRGCGARR
jgi:hypothetical protein